MKQSVIHSRLTRTLQLILAMGLVMELLQKQWFAAFTTLAIIVITFLPQILVRRFRVYIPPEFALASIVFVIASLFFGEIQGYYAKFWWWDIVLHAGSGFLLGIIGFMLVHSLNETREIGVHLKPGFVSLFAFMFAVGVGALWEIFEFGMDNLFDMNMQKEMLGDPSGLTDTMWDLIVDTAGASIIATLGYGYIKTQGNKSFLERWISSFINNNPHLFKGGEEQDNQP